MRSFKMTVVAVATVALVAGCGGGFEDESAVAIEKVSFDAMKSLKSLRIEGAITTDDQEISLDLSTTTDGDCSGTIGLGEASAEVLKIGEDQWFKANEAFWLEQAGPQGEQISSLVGDKWVVLPAEQSDFTSFCDLDEFLDEIDNEDDEGPDPEKVGTEEVDGQEAVKLTDETDEGDPVTVWVATDDEHYLLKLEVTEGEEPGVVTLSEFDEELDLDAPAEDDVVDLSQLAP